jgi:hypothetical protein
VDATHPISAPAERETSLDGILLLPVPEHPAECADAAVVLRLLASGVPLLLLPDLAWPGRISTEPEHMVTSAAVTGPIGIVGGSSTEWSTPSAAPAGGRRPSEDADPDTDFPARQRAC